MTSITELEKEIKLLKERNKRVGKNIFIRNPRIVR